MQNSCFFQYRRLLLLAAIFATAVFSACEKDEPIGDDNEQELITTVKVILAGAAVGGEQTFTWRDTDGAGGAAPSIDTIILKPESTYALNLRVLDESQSPPEDLTSEVETEADDHIFVFTASGVQVTIAPDDKDNLSLPVGLVNTLKSGQPSAGSIRIRLKHKADKTNPLTTGETDVDVSFHAVIR
jgi:hypothetical protein